MSKGPADIPKYRRRRQKKTNYKTRLELLKSGIPRLVVRTSNKHVRVQVVKYAADGDIMITSSISSDLKNIGWNHPTSNIPSAYLTGILCGKKTVDANIKTAILDLGLSPIVRGSKIFAAVKGVRDAGLDVPVDEAMLPSEARLSGEHAKSKDIKQDFEKIRATILKK